LFGSDSNDRSAEAVQRWSEIVAIAFVRYTGVEGCANAQSADGDEILGRKRALEVECGGDRSLGSREGDAKRVAERLENVAAVRFHRGAPDRVVPLHRRRHRLAMRVPALRARLNIREEKRDHSRRKRHAVERSRGRETACHASRFGVDFQATPAKLVIGETVGGAPHCILLAFYIPSPFFVKHCHVFCEDCRRRSNVVQRLF